MAGSDRTCRNCGGALWGGTQICPRCGYRALEPAPPAPQGMPPRPGPGHMVISRPALPAAFPATPPAASADHWWYADNTAVRHDYQEETRSLPSGRGEPYRFGESRAPYPPPRAPFPPDRPPSGPQPPDERSGRGSGSRAGLIAAIAAVVVLVGGAAGAVVVLHPFSHHAAAASTPTTSPSGLARASGSLAASAAPSASATVTERQAATSVARLLARSGSDRTAIISAVNDVSACGPNLAGDPKVFEQAASSRQSLLRDLASMPGRGALPRALITDLTGAWQASTAADNDFARWAKDEIAKGCVPNDAGDPGFQAAATPDSEASTDKNAFVAQWNPLAARYGLPQYQADQI